MTLTWALPIFAEWPAEEGRGWSGGGEAAWLNQHVVPSKSTGGRGLTVLPGGPRCCPNRGRERCSGATGPLVYPKHAFCPSFSSFCSCCSALPWLTPVSATRAGPSTVRRNGPPHLTKAPRSSGRAVTARSRRAEGHVFETLHC